MVRDITSLPWSVVVRSEMRTRRGGDDGCDEGGDEGSDEGDDEGGSTRTRTPQSEQSVPYSQSLY